MILHYKLFYAFNTSSYHNDLQVVQTDGKFLTSCVAIAFCLMPPAPHCLVVTVHVQYRPYATRGYKSLPSHPCFVFGETWVQTSAFVQVKLSFCLRTLSWRKFSYWGTVGVNNYAYFGYPEFNFVWFYSVPHASSGTVPAFTPCPVLFTFYTSRYTAIILYLDVNSMKIPHGAVSRKTIKMVCMKALSHFILEIMTSTSRPWRRIVGAQILTQLILNPGTRLRWGGELHATAALHPRK